MPCAISCEKEVSQLAENGELPEIWLKSTELLATNESLCSWTFCQRYVRFLDKRPATLPS